MSVNLTVGGVVYPYPVLNSETWSSDATDWAVAVSNELSAAVAIGDIGPNTLVTINNNVVVATNVTNAVIDPATLRAAVIEYYVHRVTTGPAAEYNEVGSLYCIYNDTLAAWDFAQTGVAVGSTGVTFSINASGNLQYVSSNLSGTHIGTMKFRVRALQKT